MKSLCYVGYYVGVQVVFSLLYGHVLYRSADWTSTGMIAAYVLALLPVVLYIFRRFESRREFGAFFVKNFSAYFAGAALLFTFFRLLDASVYGLDMELHVLSFQIPFTSMPLLRSTANFLRVLLEPRHTLMFNLVFPLYVCVIYRERLERMMG